jgi:hypothetical protein
LVELGKNLKEQAEVRSQKVSDRSRSREGYIIFLKHRFLAIVILPLKIAI